MGFKIGDKYKARKPLDAVSANFDEVPGSVTLEKGTVLTIVEASEEDMGFLTMLSEFAGVDRDELAFSEDEHGNEVIIDNNMVEPLKGE